MYKAKDHKLNRFVAVKVLKQEFKDDSEFISKFRVEAQAAGGLAHANIVNVYDVGEENGINFIVMELVEGITLKAYIAKKGKLSVREATSIMLQVAAGLEAAHNNGIIHRDVKPQNIIISVDGKAKVADFGIARAASSNTINSSAMGSVHYSSPEQTRGGYSDAKSDIYSLGITMYEMLTGRVPFDGDSTVAVALKHLQEEIQSPRKLEPEIPFSTEQIILKCTQKSPDRRYANMTELIRDLKESLVNPEGNFVAIPKPNPNAHTILLSKEEMEQIKSGAMPVYDENLNTGAVRQFSDTGNVTGEKPRQPYGENYYQNSGYQGVAYNRETNYPGGAYAGMYQDAGVYSALEELEEQQSQFDEEMEEFRRKKRKNFSGNSRRDREDAVNPGGERLITVISIILAVAVGCVLLAMLGRALGIFHFGSGGQQSSTQNNPQTVVTEAGENTPVQVPQLEGKTEAEAQSTLRELKLGYKYQGEAPSTQYAKGLVISQSVEPGSMVEKNTTVGYTLSSGSQEPLTVPGLSGVSREEAEKALTGMGLMVSVDNSRYSDTVDEGLVITTNPGAGSNVNVGDTVTLYISQGAEGSTVVVPKVVGHYVEDARVALGNLGLFVYYTEVVDPTVEKGLVISQDIPEGTSVKTGTNVTITVSAGSGDGQSAQGIQDGKWMCSALLVAPQDTGEVYEEELVRIVVVQNEGLENETKNTVFEGIITFPYSLNVEGAAGVSTGTAYVYVLNAQTWEIETTIKYPIEFEQVS